MTTMVRDAEATASSAEASTTNPPGYCLQWSRERAAIPARYPDAATAWRNAARRHKGDPNPPRGAFAYWTGGSNGYGHIAVSLGNGKVRSTDADGAGNVATVSVGWVAGAWGLPYVGWADNVNGETVPGVAGEEDDMPYSDWPEDDRKALAHDVAAAVWSNKMDVTSPEGKTSRKSTKQVLREVWQRVAKAA